MRRAATRLGVGACASLLGHLAVFGWLGWAGQLPDVGFEIQLPSQIELGVAEGGALAVGRLGLDAAALPASTAASAPESQPAPPSVAPLPAPPKPKPRKPKPKPRTQDAGAQEEAVDAGPDAPGPHAPGADGAEAPRTAALAAYAPPGAQLALRVDLDRVRASPLATDARDLLAAIPDFGLLLDGSGVDPLVDLSRLFIASPNLQRSSFVLAGKYAGGEEVPRHAVESLARARGKNVKWSRRGGISIAPWENADATARVLALLAPQLFAITRPDDLPRIVSIARALSARRRHGTPAEAQDSADALLAMEDNEVVAFSVENAKSFVHGKTEQVPERLSISIRLEGPDTIRVVSTGTYASDSDAVSALTFWQNIQQKFARHPLVALVGMSGPVRDTTLVAEHATLVAQTQLTIEQTQRILAFVRDTLVREPQGATRSSSGGRVPERQPAGTDPPAQDGPEQ